MDFCLFPLEIWYNYSFTSVLDLLFYRWEAINYGLFSFAMRNRSSVFFQWLLVSRFN